MTDSEEKENDRSWKEKGVEKLKMLHPKRVKEKLPWSEVRKNLLAQLGIAFGTVIGFIWTQVVVQFFNAFGVPLAAGLTTPLGWLLFVIAAIVVTFIAVFGMIFVARWQGKPKE